MSNTSIEWTSTFNADGTVTKGMTWNPVTGCTEVSPGCDHCYARTMASRLQAMGQAHYANGFEVTLHEDFLGLPLLWKKPRRVFVNSMSDLFHKDVPDDFIIDVFKVMALANQHIYQVLTKRPSRLTNTHLVEKITSAIGSWPSHIWLGVSVETQDYTWRINALRRVPVPTRFLSCEPLLGPLSLNLDGIRWVIAGAESGHGARAMNEDWVRNIRDRCISCEIAFFYKQNARNGHKIPLPELDGKVWNQFPK